ncbi:MAG: ATP-dependent Clp protease proteolytic subunit [Acidothermaceae bacterium]
MGSGTDDILGRLFERRLVMAHGRLNAELADTITAQLITLDADGDEPIELLIDCPDSELDPAFTVLDVCDSLRAPLTIVVTGRLTGAAVLLLTSRHRRVGRPHATLQLCEPKFESSMPGTAETIARLVEEHRRRIGALIERISDRTTRPEPLIADEMSRGIYLTSDQAVAYGLLDDVVRRAPA